MVLTENLGFFPDYYLKVKNSQDDFDKKIEKIGEFVNDYERMTFVDELPWVREHDEHLIIQRDFSGKNTQTALDLKEKGHLAFKAKKWIEAMLFYTQSYVKLPAEKVTEKAVALANRSATLYHMQKYDESLIDIQRAIDLGYPKDMIYKLHERQARCYLALKDYHNAITHFKKCITAMDNSNLPRDKRGKLNLDAMTMIKLLETDPKIKKSNNQVIGKGKHSLAIPDEKGMISAAIRFDKSHQEGRFVRAAEPIVAGDEILVEKPFVAALLERHAKSHCENCFIRTVMPVACPNCADVVYCSEKCLERAAKSYHKYECGMLTTIWRSGISINCHLALRMIASRSLSYYLEIADKIDNELTIEEIRKLPENDYLRVAHLVRHQDKRTASNLFQHTLMARFLRKCLEAAGYFDESLKPEAVHLIDSILLHSLQFIQYNTHEVAELHKSQKDGKERSVFIGGALYPTLALFNHSCDPSVVRYFRGTMIHVSTIKPIEAGLQISENYGPIYTQETREERQSKLRELYCFDCSCDACLENWPTFDKLPTDIIRFRCDAPNTCTSVIEVPPTCNDFMIKCVTCGECTNIFKGLKVMQDTEMMIRTAKRLYDTGEYSKALNKFIDLIRIMYEVLAPPFPDFIQCQQYLKDCFLHFGNSYDID